MKLVLFLATLLGVSTFAKADHNPYYGYGSINAQIRYCGYDLCTYDIYWNSQYQQAVVTVEIPGETQEKVFACHGGYYATGVAPWIARGKTYIFRLYNSSNCSYSVSYYSSPAAQTYVFGGQ